MTTGPATWLTLLLFLGFAAVMGAYLAATGRQLRRYRPVQRGFICPRRGGLVHGSMVRDTAARRWTGVSECSGRVPGQQCTLGCVELANAADAVRRAGRN